MNNAFINKLYKSHIETEKVPSPYDVCNTIEALLQILFPEFSEVVYTEKRSLINKYESTRYKLYKIIGHFSDKLTESPEIVENKFFESLPHIYDKLQADAEAILKGDPAAVDKVEVIRTYPGFLALAVYRIAHQLFLLNVPLIPRILTEHAHSKTGIDIHFGAKIGENICIDHGTGVVIGETAVIGDNVKIYQGVTLGALSVSKEMAKIKRHPTIEDRVILYSGATILGGDTIIGHDSVIGGNVWVTKSVRPYTKLYHKAFFKKEGEGELEESNVVY
ncbi:MAG TPA: serine O-acetyltransferase [Cyclobacteriaceae bacterium]